VREDPNLFSGTVNIGGNVRTLGDQSYVGRNVNFAQVTLDFGGELSIVTGLPAPGQSIDPAQVASFGNLNLILRGASASFNGSLLNDAAFGASGAANRARRILPPVPSIANGLGLGRFTLADGGLIRDRVVRQQASNAGAGQLEVQVEDQLFSSVLLSTEVEVGAIDSIVCEVGEVTAICESIGDSSQGS
jgi:hypothetical protein